MKETKDAKPTDLLINVPVDVTLDKAKVFRWWEFLYELKKFDDIIKTD